MELFDLRGKVGLSCELLLHVGEHLKLDGPLLVAAGLVLVLVLHHLGHVLHHVGLHLDYKFLLDLHLVQILIAFLLHYLCPKLLLQFVHFDHPWLLSLQ